ncbi:MAG: DUF1810 domain-containing protein [Burkholderiales bacterium]
MPRHDDDPFDLDRFVRAQEVNYADALAEMRAGRKVTHWSWYVLPQVRGLGSSGMSVRYAISGLPEAKAYLDHPVLGTRLRECVAAMNGHAGRSAASILGGIDARKFHSCLTLFAQAAGTGSIFHEALATFFSGMPDSATVAILERMAAGG